MTRPFSKWVWGGVVAFCTLVPVMAQISRWSVVLTAG